MNFCFEMAVNALEITLILSFLVQYFGYKTMGSARFWGTGILAIISFCNVAFFSWNHLYESYASSLQIIINIVFCCIFLRGSLFQKIFISAFSMGLTAIISSFTALLIAGLSNNQVTFLLGQFSEIRIAAILVSKLLFFIVTRIVLRIKEDGKIKWIDFISLIIIPTLSIISITLMMYAAIQEPNIQSTILYAVCIVLLLNLLIYFLFVRFGQISKVQTEAALLGLQNECLQQNTKDIANMYETVRALRHDLKNHLLCISSMADEQNICEIKQYIDQLLKQQDAVNKQITFSGNTALDAIVNSKTAAANRVGVQVHTIITTALAGVSPEDITIIIGNALDNAIRAAKDSEGKKVDLQIQPQGMYHSIMISNDIADSVLSRNPSLHTTNPVRHRHGFGIKNMRQVVEYNQGMMRFYEQENRFICDILLLNMQSGNE